MKKSIFLSVAFLFSVVFFSHAPAAFAVEMASPEDIASQDEMQQFISFPTDFFKAEVLEIVRAGTREDPPGFFTKYQTVKVKILEGVAKDRVEEIYFPLTNGAQDAQALEKGDAIVVGMATDAGKSSFIIYDRYRVTSLFLMGLAFFALVLFFGSKKGFFSIVGLCVSIFVLIFFMLPKIIAGENPLLISMMGAGIISVSSLYLAHGFQKRTTIALISTLLTLGLSFILTIVFVGFTKLTGTGSEDAFALQLDPTLAVNLKGLLLGGIIIGVLGVLDDVTTAQVATVDEIYKANPRLTFQDLYSRGLSVGREHIASLVNTLVLAYAGGSLPLLLLFTLNKEIPLWVTLNSESIAEEIVRTLIGSMTLLLAVPISTFLACYFFKKGKKARE